MDKLYTLYAARNAEILELLAKLSNRATLPVPSDLNWGHVGDQARVIQQLKEIADFWRVST